MKDLTAEGVGTVKNKTQPVLKEDEQKLWDTNVFNIHTSVGLTNIVFFYNCKAFGFRGMDEHATLRTDQFTIQTQPGTGLKLLEYTGRVCKNVQGGLRQRAVDVKQIEDIQDDYKP